MIAHSGIGTYLRAVLPHLFATHPDWRVTLLGNPASLASFATEPQVTVVPCHAPIYSIGEQFALLRLLPRDAVVFWSPHYNVPLFARVPLVVSIHDLAHLRLAEYAHPARRAYARLMLNVVRGKSAAVMFNSEFTRGEFEQLLGAPRGHGETVLLGLPSQWLESVDAPAERPIEAPYFLYVGNAKPHKNLGVLLDAFLSLRDQLAMKLVIIGTTAGLRTGDPAIVSRLQVSGGVVLLGHVEGNVLRAYMKHATALVLPSVYEGFGYPPLEAMAVGCPAIVARAGSLPEVCGDAAAYFSPADTGELEQVMRRIARDGDLRASMVSRGKTRVRLFDARRTAGRVGEILSLAANG